jgi:hypothetical protein
MWMIFIFLVWMTFFYIPYNRTDPIRRYMNGKPIRGKRREPLVLRSVHVAMRGREGIRQSSVTRPAGMRDLPWL